MKLPRLLHLLAAALACSQLPAAEKLVVTVTHTLPAARPSETITVPWTELSRSLPGALLQHLVVRDPAGHSLPYQVTNVAPRAKDPQNLGVAYGELIFQHDFAAGEKSAAFTVERLEEVAPVYPAKTYGRHVPERLDDFAWENDKVAHRIYGPALAAPDVPPTGKEVLVTSGIDVWCKRVSYPIVDRWYNKGHDHYHKDEGEGMDMFSVGPSRGCGGTGIWDGHSLAVAGNYSTWKILANGPVRTIFEVSYDAWDASGLKVSETKRFTVDAGHNLDQIDSTFTVLAGQNPELRIGIGLTKKSTDKKLQPEPTLVTKNSEGALSLWVEEKTNGSLGTAVIVPGDSFAGFAEDELNQLVLAKAASGKPLRYYAGAAWSRAGDFTTRKAWDDYVAGWALRLRNPIKVSCAAQP